MAFPPSLLVDDPGNTSVATFSLTVSAFSSLLDDGTGDISVAILHLTVSDVSTSFLSSSCSSELVSSGRGVIVGILSCSGLLDLRWLELGGMDDWGAEFLPECVCPLTGGDNDEWLELPEWSEFDDMFIVP